MSQRDQILKLAFHISKIAGAFLKKKFTLKKEASRKESGDEWSTPADLESEELIRRLLEKEDSQSGVLGEEYGWVRPDAKGWWCIDPLDGTSNFIRGIPYFSVSIAYMEEGEPTVGVVYDPIQESAYFALKGKKARWKQGKTELSLRPQNRSPLLIYSLNMSRKGKVPGWASRLVQTAKLRNFGSMALQLSQVAQGQIDYCISDRAHLWDIAAAGLILQQTHGKLTGFSHKPLLPIKKEIFLDAPSQVLPFVAVTFPRIKQFVRGIA